ncbi:MAG TPA: hypothetical protein VE981_15235 [Planctomycetota bacterium]|nr:hypothetical protein [Planctomycetota bacterium]
MKSIALLGGLVLLSLCGTAHADDVEALKAAVSKLAEASGYSWTHTLVNPKNRTGVEGKTQKEGATWVVSKGTSGTNEWVRKGDRRVLKTAEGWKTTTTADSGDVFRPQAPPTETALGFIAAIKEVKAGAAGFYSGELLEAQTKEIIHPGGSKPPESGGIANAKGTIKFWVKDGVLTRLEARLTGHSTVGKSKMEIDHDKNITIEVKDIGSVKIDLPAEAAKLLE